jgi:hypothetical protein
MGSALVTPGASPLTASPPSASRAGAVLRVVTRGSLSLATTAAMLALADTPAIAQRPAARAGGAVSDSVVASPADDSVLHVGATVKVTSPAWGPDTVPGRVVRLVQPAGCLGVLLVPRDHDGRQVILLLPGLTSVQVDDRTNLGVYSDGISLPRPSDWHFVPRDDLLGAEPECPLPGANRLAPRGGSG